MKTDNPYFTTGRPTTYNGIRMRSRLEATWAARLDELDYAWEYEPRCFANQHGQYLPDFYVVTDAMPCYLEVKGVIDDSVAIRRRVEIIFDSEPNASLVVVRGEPWPDAPLDCEAPDFWHFSHSWYRGWQGQWDDSRASRVWEYLEDTAADWHGPDGVDYEIRIEGTDW